MKMPLLFLFAHFLVIGATVTHAGIFDSTSIKTVKAGAHNACPDYSIEMLYSNVLEHIKWDQAADESGRKFINISGTMNFQGSPSHAIAQYGVENGDVIYLSAVEINRRPLNDYAISQMIDEMCILAEERSTASQSSQQAVGNSAKVTVLSVSGYGEEGVLLSTDEGVYRFNFFALDDGDYELMEEAARVNGMLCVHGQDPMYKDSISSDC